MISEQSVLAIVPARGGSKGIPRKNLAKVGGISLVGRVGQLVADIDEIDTAIVSTDSDEIAEEAKRFGLSFISRRPEDLSGDLVGDRDVLLHELDEAERHYAKTFPIVVMLQPTSPLREPRHVKAALELFAKNGADSVWTVSQVSPTFNPDKQLRIDANGQLHFWTSEGPSVIARQQLTPSFVRNGVAYVIRSDFLRSSEHLLGERSFPLLIDGPQISIDTPKDLIRVDELLVSRERGGKG